MMQKLVKIIKDHKWAILLAVLAGIIVASPQIYFRYEHQDIYQEQGIEILRYSPWIPLVREAFDGHFALGSPFFKDGKDDPYLHQPIDTAIVVLLGRLFFLDFNDTLLLSRLFFPFLLFLLIYGFVLLFSKDKLTALVSSSAVILGSTLFGRQELFQLLRGESPVDAFPFFQPVVPTLPLLFFFSFLLFFWLFIEKKQWRWGIVSTIILGLTFYEYFYNWTFLYAFAGMLGLIYLFQKRWQDVKRIALILLGSLLLAIPYFLNLYRATLYPIYDELEIRFGIIKTHAPILGFLAPFLLVVFLLFFPRKYQERYFFGLALVVAPLLALNQQLITGRIMEPGHYHWRYSVPLAIIFLLVIFFSWFLTKKWQILKKMLAFLIIGISVYAAIFIQTAFYADSENKAVQKQRYGPLMEWLNENAEKEGVVFSDADLSYLVTIYTPLNIFYHPLARYYLSASRDRLLNDLFLYYRLDGIGEKEAEAVFFQEQEKIKLSVLIYGMYYQVLTGSYKNIPDEIIQGFIQEYQASLAIPTDVFLKGMWESSAVDYLVWDTKTNPQWQLDQYLFLKKTAEIGDFIIYQKE